MTVWPFPLDKSAVMYLLLLSVKILQGIQYTEYKILNILLA
jgi:hypothetical protein